MFPNIIFEQMTIC